MGYELTGKNKDFRGQLDLAVARAVGSAPVLAEYLLPLLKSSGEAILYKGQWSKNEEEELIRSLSILNVNIKLWNILYNKKWKIIERNNFYLKLPK